MRSIRLIRELEIKTPIRLVLQDCWSDYDSETGVLIAGTENPTIPFDAECYESGTVRLCVSPTLVFPWVWDINTAFPEFYLRKIVTLNTIEELILYTLSHEYYHLRQWEHPKEAQTLRKLTRGDNETLADFFAIQTLSKHRYPRK